MALSQPAIRTRIKDAMDAQYGAAADEAERLKFCNAMATALLAILTTDSAVSTTVVGTCSTGPIAGTGTGTIS